MNDTLAIISAICATFWAVSLTILVGITVKAVDRIEWKLDALLDEEEEADVEA